MAPFYLHCCTRLGWPVDEALLGHMTAANNARLAELEAKVADALKSEGESEVREALLARTEYLVMIGDRERAVAAARETTEKTVGPGQKLDIVFTLLRQALFYEDHASVTAHISKARELVTAGGDWDRRNRLKVYEAVHCMMARDFPRACALLLDTKATFTSYEMFDYARFIQYAVLMGLHQLPRVALKESIIDSAEVNSVLAKVPLAGRLVSALYECRYDAFFLALADVSDWMRTDRFLGAHGRFFCRDMRVRAYCQVLESYLSVSLASLASAFGVSPGFIEAELSRFVAAGRVNCKIDAVAGTVTTTRPNTRVSQYTSAMRQADALLNRVQKLSRVVNL